MAEAKRRGYGEDGIYFDRRGDCQDGAVTVHGCGSFAAPRDDQAQE